MQIRQAGSWPRNPQHPQRKRRQAKVDWTGLIFGAGLAMKCHYQRVGNDLLDVGPNPPSPVTLTAPTLRRKFSMTACLEIWVCSLAFYVLG